MNQIKEMGTVILTAAVGTNGKETAIGGAIASIGVIATDWLGGWDKALQVLIVLMVADYVTGVLGAIKNKKVNSDVMFWGGIRKAVVLFIVGLASLLDEWIQPGAPIFRTAAIYFYGGREGLSVVENLGTIGVPLPGKIRDFLEQLSEKGNAKNEDQRV
ncbi:holin family protein [Paenibacillus aurantiacus]|uniref:Holin family protein n=1 Tax=Paenibacillus aurantiacus TaxID=1936118 RepID=A0ABV5KXY7_9BACL